MLSGTLQIQTSTALYFLNEQKTPVLPLPVHMAFVLRKVDLLGKLTVFLEIHWLHVSSIWSLQWSGQPCSTTGLVRTCAYYLTAVN